MQVHHLLRPKIKDRTTSSTRINSSLDSLRVDWHLSSLFISTINAHHGVEKDLVKKFGISKEQEKRRARNIGSWLTWKSEMKRRYEPSHRKMRRWERSWPRGLKADKRRRSNVTQPKGHLDDFPISYDKKPLTLAVRLPNPISTNTYATRGVKWYPFVDGIMETHLPHKWKDLTIDRYDGMIF